MGHFPVAPKLGPTHVGGSWYMGTIFWVADLNLEIWRIGEQEPYRLQLHESAVYDQLLKWGKLVKHVSGAEKHTEINPRQ